jgi:uncharacterized protein (UPF0332 family)
MGKEEALMLLRKAQECITEAKALYDLELYAGSINRSYYAIFNAIQSVLQYKDVMVKTHKGAHVQFSNHFIKTGVLPENIKTLPQKVENLRLRGDYEADHQLYREDAMQALSMAQEFCGAINNYFDVKH